MKALLLLLLATPAYAHIGEDAAFHHEAPLYIIAVVLLALPALVAAVSKK